MDISGIDKAALLAALYNNSKPFGMGFLHYDPTPMTVEEARGILADWPAGSVVDYGPSGHLGSTAKNLYFDYFRGRVLKVELSGDDLNTRLYNRDLGEGVAERIIQSLR